jgi:hypothetical protein
MNHHAELAVYDFLARATKGETDMAEGIRKQVAADVEAALEKQFSSGPRDKFRLRMSNIGRPTCQLWFDKNDPEDKTPLPPHFLMNMIIGDIVEAVFKGLLRAAGVEFQDNEKVTLKLSDGTEINGEYDMVMDGKVDDVKSASPWSYKNKFASLEALAQGDSFGYISQLVGYATAANKEVGGWWVVNKANGEFKYVTAGDIDTATALKDIEATVSYINEDKPFERCYEAVPETHYRKPTGNLKLGVECGFCSFKHKCWPNLQTLPAVKSTAQVPPMVDYVLVDPQYLQEEETGEA